MEPKRLLLRLALGSRLPTTSGTLRVRGLHDAVKIARDEFGIPHIEANSDLDAWFGLGFCQAQDRAFQLELRLRTARGTLAALVGEQGLAIDRLSRRIGFREASQRQLLVLADDIRSQIDAFASGINAGYSAGLGSRPHEFVLLRSHPTLWEASDVVGMGKLMSFLLIGNWDVELARLKILIEDGPKALADLNPVYPEEHPVSMPAGSAAGPAIDRLSEDLSALVAFAGYGGGSNNWVIAGKHTRSGRPLLANDPHLDPTLPPHWYLAQLRTPEWVVAGAALIGSPAIAGGHNGFAAWGITAGLADTVDLFLEEVGPDGHSIRRDTSFESCEVRRETIEVRGRATVTEEVLITPRGPIIGPALKGDLPAVSLRAVWLDAKPARGFLSVHTARSFEAFRHEFEDWPLLSQNVAYADTEGTIAWQLVGEVPLRHKGFGTLPLAGWDPTAGWRDSGVPFADMPHSVNPDSGLIASANNKPVSDGAGPYLGVDWLDGYRAARIFEMLESRADWDVAANLMLQMDQTSLTWREVREVILAVAPADSAAREALGLLASWDGVLSAGSPAATIFERLLADMWQRVARARAPKAWRWALGQGFAELLPLTTFAAGRSSRMLRLLREQPQGWFNQPWSAVIAEALSGIVTDLRAEHGTEHRSWAWGVVRPLTLEHPLGRIGFLASTFNRGPFPWGGDGNTISQAGTTPLRPEGNPLAIASLRMVVDVGLWEDSRFSLPGGQSGNPFSAHYDDLLQPWLRGEGVPIAWSTSAVKAATRQRLELVPLN